MRFEKYRHILVSVTASALLAAGLVSFVPTSEAQITPAPVVVASADHSNTYRETRTPASRGEARKPLEKKLAPVAKVEKKKAQKPAPAPAKPKPASKPQKSNSSWAAGDWERFSPHIRAAAECVARHESWNAGLWVAKNPYSSASGAFQFIDGTWRASAKRAGVGQQYARAYLAPPRVQASVFAYVWRTSPSAWNGTGCPGT